MKSTYTIALFFAAFTSLLAQTTLSDLPQRRSFQRVEVGVHASMNMGAPFPNAPINAGDKGGLGQTARFGMLCQYNITPKFSVLADWGYSRKTATFESRLVDKEQPFRTEIKNPPYPSIFIEGTVVISGLSKGSFDLQYFDFQLLPQYQLTNRLKVCAGMYGASLWSGTNKVTITEVRLGVSPEYSDDINQDNSANLASYDYGAVAGVSYKIISNCNLNFRATRGLTSIYKPEFISIPYSVNNTYLQIGADFRLPAPSPQ